MTTVVILNENSAQNGISPIADVLKGFADTIYIGNGRIVDWNNNEKIEYLICECEKIPIINTKNVIILFSQNFKAESKRIIKDEHIVIFESQNKDARELLQNSSAKGISCGFSSRDTITLSSFNLNSAVVTVQREIETIKGGLIEPCDIIVKFQKPVSEQDLLFSVTVLILSGFLTADCIFCL